LPATSKSVSITLIGKAGGKALLKLRQILGLTAFCVLKIAAVATFCVLNVATLATGCFIRTVLKYGLITA
jgi:hypothetical protein